MSNRKFIHYDINTTEAIDTINRFTNIVMEFNKTFKQELDYSIKMEHSDVDDYMWKVIFNMGKDEIEKDYKGTKGEVISYGRREPEGTLSNP